MALPPTRNETIAGLLRLIGKEIQIENPDGSGGGGVLTEVVVQKDGDTVELILDYGYAFTLQEGTVVKPV